MAFKGKGSWFGDLPERVRDKISVNPDTGCWEWTAAKQRGYGTLRVNNPRRLVRAHRWVYEYLTGETIPAGFECHHECENRACVNPDHLKPMDAMEHQVNYSPARRATHCKRGHEFNERNTYWANGWRHCRRCGADRAAAKRREAIHA